MIKKRNIILILTFFIISVSVFSFWEFQSKNNNIYTKNDEMFSPKVADALYFSAIHRNTSTVYRLFETVNFTIDTSGFTGVSYVKMQISFRNGSVRNYDMTNIGNNEFYYGYTPEYYAPLGSQNVSFLIYNVGETLLNDHTTYSNFTILSNYAIFNLEPDYYIWDTLSAGLMVYNFSGPNMFYEFEDWDITIVDSDNEATQNNLVNLDSNANQVSLLIDNETFSDVNKIYYIKVNMTELNRGTIRAAYFPFNVRNSNPIIISSIDLSPNEVFRTDVCTISLNATDIETAPQDLEITMYVQDAEGENVLEDLITYVSENSYSDTFSIASNRPTGKYRINVTVRDEDGGETSKITFLTVKNNPPKIHSYTINGLTMDQSISILYGENLVFSFNVSDVERIAYVKVALLNENNEWYNITRAYVGIQTEITVRTAELITGTWFVYVYVIDSDGAITSLTDDYDKAPQGIRIIPDVLSNYLPWILFFIGISLGILIGVGSIYKYFKSKFGEPEAISPEKKKIITKKPLTRKKLKAKPSREEFEKEEIEERRPIEEEEKKEVPKRKIKRKL